VDITKLWYFLNIMKIIKTLRQPIVLAITSLVITPLLLTVQGLVFILGDMILYEKSNLFWTKVITWLVMVGVALLAISLPTKALIRGVRERKLNDSTTKLKTTLSIVFSSIAFVLMAITQVWFLPTLFKRF